MQETLQQTTQIKYTLVNSMARQLSEDLSETVWVAIMLTGCF